jgi:hypothetical protein
VRRALLPLLLALAGCGSEQTEPQAAATPTPNPTSEATPAPAGNAANAFIGSMAVDPADETLLLGTGLGLYRVRAGAERAKRVVGRLRTPKGDGTVSSNLVLRFDPAGDLVASGHPEGEGTLPEDLGLIRSRDQGRTWEPVAELGKSDYHLLQITRDRLVGVPAEGSDVLVSADGGRSFETRSPPATPVDLAIDPADPARMVVATEQGIFTSADEGRSWRQRDNMPAEQLEWAAPDALYRSDPGGLVKVSRDGGSSWEERGTIDIGANELVADEDGVLYASVPGGEVRRSADGGASWELLLRLQ